MCWCLLAFFRRFALKVVWENLIIISFRFNLRDPKWCIILLHLEFQLTENKSPFWLLFPIFADKFTFSFVLVFILSQFPIIAPERNKTIKILSGPFFADRQRTKDTICVSFSKESNHISSVLGCENCCLGNCIFRLVLHLRISLCLSLESRMSVESCVKEKSVKALKHNPTTRARRKEQFGSSAGCDGAYAPLLGPRCTIILIFLRRKTEEEKEPKVGLNHVQLEEFFFGRGL